MKIHDLEAKKSCTDPQTLEGGYSTWIGPLTSRYFFARLLQRPRGMCEYEGLNPKLGCNSIERIETNKKSSLSAIYQVKFASRNTLMATGKGFGAINRYMNKEYSRDSRVELSSFSSQGPTTLVSSCGTSSLPHPISTRATSILQLQTPPKSSALSMHPEMITTVILVHASQLCSSF